MASSSKGRSRQSARRTARGAPTPSAPVKEWWEHLRAFLDDEGYSGKRWLRDGVALTLKQWGRVASAALKATASQSPAKPAAPSCFVSLDFDETSEAVDPVEIEVDPGLFRAIRDGTVRPLDLVLGDQTIPAANLRLSISAARKKAYVSLVGMGGLGLRRGVFGAAIRVHRSGGASPETIGVAAVAIAAAPAA